MTRTLTTALAWAADGAAHLRGLMMRMGDDAFAAPSALPGWSRGHVLTHVARNADALINLLAWARTGVPTPAYASREQRDAEIEAGSTRSPAVIRDDVIDSSDRLAKVVREMPAEAWKARVENAHGKEVAATDIPWFRARETWIHAVDLDVGASFADLPAPMLTELADDVTSALGRKPECPPVRLVASDLQREWTLGAEHGASTAVCGPAVELVGWLLGRSRGRVLRPADGRRLPELPRWL